MRSCTSKISFVWWILIIKKSLSLIVYFSTLPFIKTIIFMSISNITPLILSLVSSTPSSSVLSPLQSTLLLPSPQLALLLILESTSPSSISPSLLLLPPQSTASPQSTLLSRSLQLESSPPLVSTPPILATPETSLLSPPPLSTSSRSTLL